MMRHSPWQNGSGWKAARTFAAGLCLAGFLGSPAEGAAPLNKLTGAILGVVTDLGGAPQMGATVLLYDRYEKLKHKVLTDENGGFRFANLTAGSYAIRVSFASFMPAVRDAILVPAGGRSVLSITLASVLSSVELSYGGGQPRSLMTDEWKWVLRTANATRPMLRFVPGIQGPNAARHSAIFSGTQAIVKVSAGDGGLVSSFGNESDLGTAFALATSLFGSNQVQVSGSVGYAAQTGLPSAGFRTSFSRNGHGERSPEVSLTMRQLYMPARVGASLVSNVGVPTLRSLSLSVDDSLQLAENMRLDYGFSMDSVTFFDRLNYLSPYAKVTYDLSKDQAIEVAYTNGVPRSDVMTGESLNASLQSEINALSVFPRISLREGRARVQRAENYEIGYRQNERSRVYRASVFRERTVNAGLSATGATEFVTSGDLLPDLFTNASVFNAGTYLSLGYLLAATQRFGEHLEVTGMYGSGGALVAERETGRVASAEELRAMIKQGRRQQATAQVSARIPHAGTHIVASYQWVDRRAATPTHYFVTQRMRSEPGLNIYVRQPIPSGPVFPVRMEVTADLRNLLQQGYLPFQFANGSTVVLMNTPRTLRGGLAFIF
ncbi:MAG: carboxypeptidase regulatory-like domain-containing protein [Bryobacteraceae bacterium]